MRVPKLCKIGNVYTQDSKEQAVAYHRATGMEANVTTTARALKITTATLTRWLGELTPKSMVSASATKLKVGDKVTIIGKASGDTNGRGVGYNDTMRCEIGKVGTIERATGVKNCFRISGSSYTWHEAWLEKLEYEKEVTPCIKYITVGAGHSSSLMASMSREHSNRACGGREVHVYSPRGVYKTYCKGMTPLEWRYDEILSFTKVDNILRVNATDVSDCKEVTSPTCMVVDGVEYVKYAPQPKPSLININGVDYVKKGC